MPLFSIININLPQSYFHLQLPISYSLSLHT
jgi:hypothetical protein